MKRILIFVLVLLFVFPAISSATVITTIDVEFDTLTAVDFATVQVTDLGNNLRFDVSLNHAELGVNADLHEFYFNLIPGFTDVQVGGPDVQSYIFEYSDLNPPKKGNRADGDGYFDVFVDFGSGTPQLSTTSFIVSADQPLEIYDIDALSEGGAKGAFYMAIHAQTTTWAEPLSNHVAGGEYAGANTLPIIPASSVPEPCTMFLVFSGLIGIAGLRKKF